MSDEPEGYPIASFMLSHPAADAIPAGEGNRFDSANQSIRPVHGIYDHGLEGNPE